MVRTRSDVLTILRRFLLASSRVQMPWFRKYITNPTMTLSKAIRSIVVRNQPNPSPPQYSVSESAAPVETVARPNMTKITEGRQHNEAMSVEPAIYFHSDANRVVGFVSSSTSSIMCKSALCFSNDA